MATRYCGIGGNDGNTGLSWAQRKLTLGGVEDTPVVADDVCYIGPGVYRELLICDVSGNAGNPITYIADDTGENTDGVGGVVRITGSDNDQTETRANCITANGIDYRTFRGFVFDTTSGIEVNVVGSPENWIVEDCEFQPSASAALLKFIGDTQTTCIVRRCKFYSSGGSSTYAIEFESAAGLGDADHLVANCIFETGGSRGVNIDDVGGIDFIQCTFAGCDTGIRITDALPGGHTVCNVYDSIFVGCVTAMQSVNLGELVENFNTFYRNNTARTNVNVGANSQTYPPLFVSQILNAGAGLVSGFKFPYQHGALSEWSQVAAITGTNEQSTDLHAKRRPATASKNSWGAVQRTDMEVETGTVQAGTYARVLHDAGSVLVRRIPVTGVEITVTLYVRREANYAGNLPRMIIKQPGAADQITTSVAAVNTWEQLSDTFTPNALPGYVEVWAQSRNTAAAGNYETFYDTMDTS